MSFTGRLCGTAKMSLVPGTSGRGHRNARLTLINLLDQCDFAIAMAPEGEEATVPLSRLRQTILDDFGFDPRAVQAVPDGG